MAIITQNGLSVDTKVTKSGSKVIGDLQGKYCLFPTINDKNKLTKSNVIFLHLYGSDKSVEKDEFIRVLQLAREVALNTKKDLLVDRRLRDKFGIVNHVKFNDIRIPMAYEEIEKMLDVSKDFTLTIEPTSKGSQYDTFYFPLIDGGGVIYKTARSSYEVNNFHIPTNVNVVLDTTNYGKTIDDGIAHHKIISMDMKQVIGDKKTCDFSNVSLVDNGVYEKLSYFASIEGNGVSHQTKITGLCKSDDPEGKKKLTFYLSNIRQILDIDFSKISPEELATTHFSLTRMSDYGNIIDDVYKALENKNLTSNDIDELLESKRISFDDFKTLYNDIDKIIEIFQMTPGYKHGFSSEALEKCRDNIKSRKDKLDKIVEILEPFVKHEQNTPAALEM